MVGTSSNVDAHLEIIPDSIIEFGLNDRDTTSKVTMTLRHPDPDSNPVAFKVKTTQPRRYLVRPNQGLIYPGKQEEIQIILVEKDKQSLLQTYERLGSAGLDHSKDKFLVQSVAVHPKSANALHTDYDQLTALWTALSSSGGGGGTAGTGAGTAASSTVANKKLSVKHVVEKSAISSTRAGGAISESSEADIVVPPAAAMDSTKLSKDQLAIELSNLRRKYDELVSFSVNLTAERDILNNTLEQTKRDLNRQIAKSAALENNAGSSAGAGAAGGGGGSQRLVGTNSADRSSSTGQQQQRSFMGKFIGFIVTIAACVVLVVVGANLQESGLLSNIPYLGNDKFIILPSIVMDYKKTVTTTSSPPMTKTKKTTTAGTTTTATTTSSSSSSESKHSLREDEL